jgi:hypothetical protein
VTDPTQSRQPTEEELRAYLEQLRAADVAGIIAQVYEMLGTTAEVKLGRPDARVLIDTMNAVVQTGAASLPDELAQRMRDGIAQLQVAQVQAEREPADEPPDAGEPSAEQPPGASEQDQRMTDRLWIPGREQPPPTTAP